MKKKRSAFLALVLLTVVSSGAAYAETLESLMERIDISGYLRLRSWSVISRTYVPDEFDTRDTYKHVNYIDLFLRTRINLAIVPEIEIRTVFDFSGDFGKASLSMGDAAANLIARDVYAVLRPVKEAELSVGLMPFSLPGGYILARDATGIQYTHNFSAKKVALYFAYIKAFDDADDSFGQGSDVPDFVWDDIILAGTRFSIGSIIKGECYYVYEDDRYTTNRLTFKTTDFTAGLEGDGRKGSLHWVGLHGRVATGNWFLRFGGIFNGGVLYWRNQLYAFRKTNILAGLFEFATGFSVNDLKLSAVAEGATGDPNNPSAGRSFQDIKGSHDFSYIVVDSNGGIALRGSGESCWYGLYGCGLNLTYTLFDSFIMDLKLLHFGSMKVLYWRGKKTTWYGDEADLGLEYRFRNILSVFLNAGGFLPQRAYNAQDNMSRSYYGNLNEVYYNDLLHDIENHASRSMIFEVMLGMKISYD
jgi:hypothetical protein